MTNDNEWGAPPPGTIGVGTILNGIFQIDEKLAFGGMGEVYRGHNIATSDPVAIKVILNELAKDETILALFYKEARILNSLHHPAIVRYGIFTVDPVTGRPYLATEFIDGPSLATKLVSGPLPPAETKLLVARIAAGLDAAHGAGVIHRDVSPDNVILVGGNVEAPKIIDFGIARATNVGTGTLLEGKFAGKYNFVSPEQLGLFGGNVTAASDVYSLGLLTVNALRGAPIDMNGTQFEIIEKHRSVPDLTDVDPEIRSVVELMLQPDPALRTVSMSDIATWFAPRREPSIPPGWDRTLPPSTGAVANVDGLPSPMENPGGVDPASMTRLTDGTEFGLSSAGPSPPAFDAEKAGQPPNDIDTGQPGSGGTPITSGNLEMPKAMRDESDLSFLSVAARNQDLTPANSEAHAGGKPRSAKLGGMWVAVLVVLAIAAAAVGGWFYLPGRPTPNSVADSTPSPTLQPSAKQDSSSQPADAPPVKPARSREEEETLLAGTANTADALRAFLSQCGPDCPAEIVQQVKDRLDALDKQTASAGEWQLRLDGAGQDAAKLQAFLNQCGSDCPQDLAQQARVRLDAANRQRESAHQWAIKLAYAGQDARQLQDLLDKCGPDCPSDIALQAKERLDAVKKQAIPVIDWAAQLASAGQDATKLQHFLDQCNADCPAPYSQQARDRLAASKKQTALANQLAFVVTSGEQDAAKIQEALDQCGPSCPGELSEKARKAIEILRVPKSDQWQYVNWVRKFDGGDCFFAHGTSKASRQLDVEGMGSNGDPFDKMDAAFQAKFGFEPDIQVRPLTISQCSVPNFLTALAPTTPTAMRITLEIDHVKSGETLKGSVEGIDRKNIIVYLIDSDGLVHPADRFFRREGAVGRLGIGIVEKEPTKPLQELVLILASDSPVPGANLTAPASANAFFPQLLNAIRVGKLQVDYSFDFFLLGTLK